MVQCGTLTIGEKAPQWSAANVAMQGCSMSTDQVLPGGDVQFTAQIRNDNDVAVNVWVKWFGNGGTPIEGAIETVQANMTQTVDTGPKTYDQLASLFGTTADSVEVDISAEIHEVSDAA